MRGVLGKAARVLVVLLLVSFALTFLLDLAPGDPAYALLGSDATAEQVAQVHQELHLDDPFYARYGRWVAGLVTGDFGTSFQTDQPVLGIIAERLPVTLELAALALLMALVIAIPLGVYTAYRADGVVDRLWTAVSSALIALPPFVGALGLVYVFAIRLRATPLRLPATGWSDVSSGLGVNLWYLALPAVTLALVEIPALSRLLRADMIATLQLDFVLAARARGLSPHRILWRHALRPSSFALITYGGIGLARLIGGAVVVEVLFALPGVGQLLVQSISTKDIVVVQGVVMFIAVGYVLVNAGVDATYRILDPRVRA